jgi:hypothetical protein
VEPAADLLVTTPRGYEPERAYAAKVLLAEFLGLEIRVQHEERADVAVSLEADTGGSCLRLPDILFATRPDDWLEPPSLPPRPVPRVEPQALGLDPSAGTVPVLYARELPGGGYLSVSETELRLGLDVFGSAFFLLSRYEELVVSERDEHDRFPAPASLAACEGFLQRPIVNEYLEVLWAQLARLWPRLERARRGARVLVSHDVDWPRCSGQTLPALLRSAAGDAVVRRDPVLALDRLTSYARSRAGRREDADLCDTFDFIMGASERRGLTSAFYFIADHTAGDIDGTYSIDDSWIRGLLRRVHGRGHEIGLHPSYETFRNPAQTRREFERLVSACDEEGIAQSEWGGRQHFLRWENPTTWRNWAAAGLSYDSTLSFADQPGFRCGVCFEYPVFDLEARTELRLRERPLVLMEYSLLRDVGFDPQAILGTVDGLASACRRFGGDFTLLWHNSRLVSRRERRCYEQVLDAAG